MSLAKRLVESILRQFDREDRELVLRWRLWTHRWFPYRVAEYKGYDEEADELILGPWEWHSPEKWRDWRRRRHG